jgi:D-alanyl-D-alanine carboxypeptidase/D-alanyl-D-alanine-endopeptidase (penicillin-binding protein 4)
VTHRGLAAVGVGLALAISLIGRPASSRAQTPLSPSDNLQAELDRIFDDPILARATVGVRVESLRDGRVIYQRHAGTHVIPASNMKLITLAAAAERLGWDHQFATHLDGVGAVHEGTLYGDLVVSGDGDPSIVSPDGGIPQLFLGWADAVREAGIRQVQGRLIGDDSAFDDDVLGAGWAWDNLDAGYAAPAGALSYNENVVEVRITAGGESGSPAVVRLTPPGATLDVTGRVVTGPPGSAASVTVARALGSTRLVVNGQVPAGGPEFVRTAPVVNPTSFFVEGLAAALTARGIAVSGGAWDLDEVAGPPPPNRFRIGERQSLPLSALAGRFMKDSQNFYGEMLLKAIGRAEAGLGTAENGRRGVRAILAAWGAGDDEVVMYDGSGLSRYNYVTADAIVRVLTQVWRDERLRGPFLASLPIGGVDGTLAARMTTPELHGRVQAKTGTINHVRALSGYLTRADGETLVFSMIANHFTAPSTAIDAVVERALATLGR